MKEITPPTPFFQEIKDPRIDRKKRYELHDIFIITLFAVSCGADTWDEIEVFGKSHEMWLTNILDLENGIPSHDTFNRVFSLLDPIQLEECFLKWMKELAELTEGEVIAIDGKTIRGAAKRGNKSFVHMVSAWAGQNNVVLGQVKVDDKSNEITAIPKLIKLLALKGCIVTIDAMGCQKKIVSAIIDQEADYLLATKGNQGGLYESIVDSFADFKPDAVSQTVDADHGRIETRTCSVISDLWMIDNEKNQWKGLKTLVRIDAKRVIKITGEIQESTRYYISSLPPDPVKINQSVRSHWRIENSLHWCLDVGFGEDASQKSTGNAARNFSIISRIALNLFKKDNKYKVGIKSKRKIAGWNLEYLMQVLNISI